ncbi:MAG: PadR family transcriptional regulator [Clostridia bacterium]|nr:PadR family transcriptional regulator [Clostridia bacterium]
MLRKVFNLKGGISVTFDKSQLMRGTLEGCILKIISEKTTYGYEILLQLKQQGFSDISEGTIYPLLLRLEKQGSIVSKLLPSPLGPKRKYYSITEEGEKYLASFINIWKQISDSVAVIIGENGEG